MSVLTHKTYFPPASKDLVLQPRLDEPLGLNPQYEMSLPQDVGDTFFHKEPPCQTLLTHLEFDAILYLVEICTEKNQLTRHSKKHVTGPPSITVFESWGINLYALVVQFGRAFLTSIVHNVCVNNACKKSDSKIRQQDHKDLAVQCGWVGPKNQSCVPQIECDIHRSTYRDV
jgi:hypothetical protein